MCPYENKHLGISSKVRAEVWNELADWEKKELNDLINKNRVK